MTNCKRTPFPVPSPRNFIRPLISKRFKHLVMSCKRCFGQMLSWASSGSLMCVGHPLSSNASRTRSWFSAGHLKCLTSLLPKWNSQWAWCHTGCGAKVLITWVALLDCDRFDEIHGIVLNYSDWKFSTWSIAEASLTMNFCRQVLRIVIGLTKIFPRHLFALKRLGIIDIVRHEHIPWF